MTLVGKRVKQLFAGAKTRFSLLVIWLVDLRVQLYISSYTFNFAYWEIHLSRSLFFNPSIFWTKFIESSLNILLVFLIIKNLKK